MGYDPRDYHVGLWPDDNDPRAEWEIIRASFKHPPALTCVSHRMVFMQSHFLNKATVPHHRRNCAGCEAKRRLDTTAYLLAQRILDNRKFLFATTAQASMSFKEAFKQFGSLRGVRFTAGRAKDAANGKVVIRINGRYDQPAHLVKDEPIWPIISHILKIDPELCKVFDEITRKEISEEEALLIERSQHLKIPHDEFARSTRQDLPGQTIIPELRQSEEEFERRRQELLANCDAVHLNGQATALVDVMHGKAEAKRRSRKNGKDTNNGN